jgi:hypothetical protein
MTEGKDRMTEGKDRMEKERTGWRRKGQDGEGKDRMVG